MFPSSAANWRSLDQAETQIKLTSKWNDSRLRSFHSTWKKSLMRPKPHFISSRVAAYLKKFELSRNLNWIQNSLFSGKNEVFLPNFNLLWKRFLKISFDLLLSPQHFCLFRKKRPLESWKDQFIPSLDVLSNLCCSKTLQGGRVRNWRRCPHFSSLHLGKRPLPHNLLLFKI